MGTIKYLILVALLTVFIQNAHCKKANVNKNQAVIVTQPRYNFFEQLNAQIKNNALAAWNFVKKAADNTQENFRRWADNARKYTEDVQKTIQRQIVQFQKSFNSIFLDTFGAREAVQNCVGDTLTNLSSQIQSGLDDVMSCIVYDLGNSTRRLKFEEAKLYDDDTQFITNLERRLETCKSDENYEECLQNVRDLVFEEIEDKQHAIHTRDLQSRSIMSDLFDIIGDCVEENFTLGLSELIQDIVILFLCVLN